MGKAQVLLYAKNRLLEGDFQIVAEAGAVVVGLASSPAAKTASKAAAENIAENVFKTAAHAAKKVGKVMECVRVLGAAAGSHAVKAGPSVLVVNRPLLFVRKDFVGFGGLLELFLGLFVAGVSVRMVFYGQLAVSPFDFVNRGAFFYSQYFVTIAFCRHNSLVLFHSQPSPLFRADCASGGHPAPCVTVVFLYRRMEAPFFICRRGLRSSRLRRCPCQSQSRCQPLRRKRRR